MDARTLSKIADTIMYGCGGANALVSVLYLLAHSYWKSLYWFAAALIVLAVTKMLG